MSPARSASSRSAAGSVGKKPPSVASVTKAGSKGRSVAKNVGSKVRSVAFALYDWVMEPLRVKMDADMNGRSFEEEWDLHIIEAKMNGCNGPIDEGTMRIMLRRYPKLPAF